MFQKKDECKLCMVIISRFCNNYLPAQI